MSAAVFLARCDPADFDRTVRSPVDLGEYEDPPSELGAGTVRLWGVADGTRNRENFERLEAGDLVLFYADGAYVGSGRVGTTFEDEAGWAAETLWSGEPTPLLVTLESFAPAEVPRAAVNRIFDYSASYTPPGLQRVADGKVSNRPAAIERALELYSASPD